MIAWLNDKKHRVLLIVVFGIIVLLTCFYYLFWALNAESNYSKSAADLLVKKGISAQQENDIDSALIYFKQAKEQYDSIGDKNGSVNADSMIFLLEKQ